ncbi:hypothetical protein DPMN_166717 [Dreissena polymorpha]|uniref:Uncharacterized protein n=1 Tax=Dreissena polymorpha TaxID=45954 RepID=A0A9D4IXV2_DREPO|nr:hypothetical protein DPMN_166717 [Dreissena polymorpha]
MLKAMAKDAGFPEHKRITNHSVRKFLVQKLSNANIPPTEIMALQATKMSSALPIIPPYMLNSSKSVPTVLPSQVNATSQQLPLVHIRALKLWPKCSLDNHCLPLNKLILIIAPPSHFTSKCLSLVRTTSPSIITTGNR